MGSKMADYSNIKDKIAILLSENNKTTSDLANDLGWTERRVADYVTGKRIPNMRTLTELSDYFGEDILYFFEYVN
jgi:transcriptional regulator with XRE-family HTH domain